MKTCSCCKSTKIIDCFPNNKNTKDKKGYICRTCLNEKERVKRRKLGIPEKKIGVDAEKRKETRKKWREERKNKSFPLLYFKNCNRCKLDLEITNFTKDEKTKDGFRNYCKQCRKETSGVTAKKYKVKNWAKILILNAKRHSLQVEVDENFILSLFEKQNGKCFWYKVNLIPSEIEKFPNQPSLDRLDRNIGYTKENVVLACYTANIGRNITSQEVFQVFCDELLKRN
jgi:hypothetical protein